MQHQAVQQLRLVRGQKGRQFTRQGRVGVGVGQGPWHGLLYRHLLQQRRHLFKCACRGQAVLAQCIDAGQHGARIAPRQRAHETTGMAAVDAAEHGAHGLTRQRAAAESDGLIGQRQAVAHRTACRTRQQFQRQRVMCHALGLKHVLEVLLHHLGCHRAQVELQAARQHRGQHLLRVGGGQHKL